MKSFVELMQQTDHTVVIAEAGVNHNGDEAVAHQLIDVAADARADVVKFQTFDPEKLVAPNTAATPYQRERASASEQGELLRQLVLPEGAWKRLRDHAHDRGIAFLSTPFDMDSARMLVDLGVDAIKLSSGELTNVPFLTEIAGLGLPLLISTGMGSVDEVAAAVEACRAAPFLAVFHCVSAYPAPHEDCNLLAIPTMAAAFDVPVGWSDHTIGNDSALVAATTGARFFEKHFTLDCTMPGPDHAASLEPAGLRAYVEAVRSVRGMLGDGMKRPMPSEEDNAKLVRRSWHASHDLESGHVLTRFDVVALRPESGITPTIDLRGRVLRTHVAAGEPIKPDSLEDHR